MAHEHGAEDQDRDRLRHRILGHQHVGKEDFLVPEPRDPRAEMDRQGHVEIDRGRPEGVELRMIVLARPVGIAGERRRLRPHRGDRARIAGGLVGLLRLGEGRDVDRVEAERLALLHHPDRLFDIAHGHVADADQPPGIVGAEVGQPSVIGGEALDVEVDVLGAERSAAEQHRCVHAVLVHVGDARGRHPAAGAHVRPATLDLEVLARTTGLGAEQVHLPPGALEDDVVGVLAVLDLGRHVAERLGQVVHPEVVRRVHMGVGIDDGVVQGFVPEIDGILEASDLDGVVQPTLPF